MSVLFCALLVVSALSQSVKKPGEGMYYRPLPLPLPLPVSVLHQFPAGTWLENLAVRPNGKIPTTALSSPEIFEVDNDGVQPVKVVHTFAHVTSCTGITHLGRDEFYVIAGNVSLTASSVSGPWSVYKVDVRHHHRHTTKPKPAAVSLVAYFPGSIVLNGITVLNRHKKWFLVSNSSAGVVYRLEGKTGKVVKVIDDPLMKPSSGTGVNGIKIRKKWLYFTNTSLNILARINIHGNGTPKAPATVVAPVDSPDDFTFDGSHNVLVAQGNDRLGEVGDDNKVVTLAGDPPHVTDGELFGPTAVVFAKFPYEFVFASTADWTKVYISTNGGAAQYQTENFTRGGTISVVEVGWYSGAHIS